MQKLRLRKEQQKQKRDSLTSTDLHPVNRDIDMFEMIDYISVTQDTDQSEHRTESTTVNTPTVTISY